jgi:dethiobiotin synthetase
LVRALRAAGRPVQVLKPVISGYDPATFAESDTAVLLAALDREPKSEVIDAISPWRFAAPLSLNMAARREGRGIDFDELCRYCRETIDGFDGVTLIEGAGGVMVPLTEERTVIDWIVALDVPALLVVGSYLGTLSHTLTAHTTLSAHGIPVAAIVISESAENPVPLEETQATLAGFLPGVAVSAVARGDTDSDDLVRLLFPA